MLTIFTPAYNRANTLPKLYQTLLNQTNQTFEWVVVDDGSTDNTEEVMQGFINDGKLEINYSIQPNGGKHTAINRGVSLAKGEFFFIVDSDDWLPTDSVEIVYKWISSIENLDNFAGVGGIKAFVSGDSVGATFEGLSVDCTSLERNKNNILGDKAEVFYTSILREHPFPVFEGENFLSEAVIWNAIANKGLKIRWFNEITYFCEYLEDGLSKSRGLYFKNFQGNIESTKRDLSYKEHSFKFKIKRLLVCCVYAKKKKYSYKQLSKQLSVSTVIIFLFANIGSVIYRILGGSVE